MVTWHPAVDSARGWRCYHREALGRVYKRHFSRLKGGTRYTSALGTGCLEPAAKEPEGKLEEYFPSDKSVNVEVKVKMQEPEPSENIPLKQKLLKSHRDCRT